MLQKPIYERTPTELAFLTKCTENVGFFKKYDEETHLKCMAKMYHVHLKPGERCIEWGKVQRLFISYSHDYL